MMSKYGEDTPEQELEDWINRGTPVPKMDESYFSFLVWCFWDHWGEV